MGYWQFYRNELLKCAQYRAVIREKHDYLCPVRPVTSSDRCWKVVWRVQVDKGWGVCLVDAHMEHRDVKEFCIPKELQEVCNTWNIG